MYDIVTCLQRNFQIDAPFPKSVVHGDSNRLIFAFFEDLAMQTKVVLTPHTIEVPLIEFGKDDHGVGILGEREREGDVTEVRRARIGTQVCPQPELAAGPLLVEESAFLDGIPSFEEIGVLHDELYD